MDRLKEIAAKIIADYKEHYDFPWQGESHMEDCIMMNLQSLSQEAVRSEADVGLFSAGRMLGFTMGLEEAAKVCERHYENMRHYHAIWPGSLLQSADAIRSLKREPNAAGQAGQRTTTAPSHKGHAAGPAPAAPDAVIVRLKQLAGGQGTVSPERRHDAKAIAETCNQAAALLAKLGQDTSLLMDAVRRYGSTMTNDEIRAQIPGASDE